MLLDSKRFEIFKITCTPSIAAISYAARQEILQPSNRHIPINTHKHLTLLTVRLLPCALDKLTSYQAVGDYEKKVNELCECNKPTDVGVPNNINTDLHTHEFCSRVCLNALSA
uniref:Uncharacterized protein n=1 Tax=Ceratitis capitata TaxID=7213 RepID=W8BCE0_CERCA